MNHTSVGPVLVPVLPNIGRPRSRSAVAVPRWMTPSVMCTIWYALIASSTWRPRIAGRGIAQLITEGVILTFNVPELIFVGSGSVFGIPFPVILWIVIGIAASLLFRTTALGLLVEAIGINRRASALAGIGTSALLLAVYAASGLCAAVAGIVAAADIRGADANNAGLWLELDAILTVVVGGNSLMGGRFSIAGSLIGAMIIQSVNTGILLAGFPPEFNLVIKAAIIVVILVVQSPASHTLFAFFKNRPGRTAGAPVPPKTKEEGAR